MRKQYPVTSTFASPTGDIIIARTIAVRKGTISIIGLLTHTLIHHLETVPNSKKLLTTNVAIKEFSGTDSKENIVGKSEIVISPFSTMFSESYSR